MKKIKIILIILFYIACAGLCSESKSPAILLQEALYAEKTEGDIDKAIDLYMKVIEAGKEADRLAGHATYHIGLCFLKKGDKSKAAEYFEKAISEYSEHPTLVKKAREQLEKIKPEVESIFEKIGMQAIQFISRKYGETAEKAIMDNITVNSHIYYVDTDFMWHNGGMGYLYNWTGRSIDQKTRLSGTSYPDQTLYDATGQKLKTVIEPDERRKNFYHIYWIPDEPLKPGESLYYGWSLNRSGNLPEVPSGSHLIRMQNKYGSHVLETFFLVLPKELTITNDNPPTGKESLIDVDVYWWTKQVGPGENHVENVKIVESGSEAVSKTNTMNETKKTLSYDDGNQAGKWSYSGGGHAVKFDAPGKDSYLTAIKLYGSRYGEYEPPKENFVVWLCDKNFKPVRKFKFPYSLFEKRGYTKWVELDVPETKLPDDEFVICVSFDPHRTKGIYLYHDAKSSGHSYRGLPRNDMEKFQEGDWMLRAEILQKGESNGDVVLKDGFENGNDVPEIVGHWKSVDFVESPEQFKPNEMQWKGGDLFLKEIKFYPSGKSSKTLTWKDNLIYNRDGKNKAKYLIKKINGEKYLFLPWLSGDVTGKGMKPKYYVLKADSKNIGNNTLQEMIDAAKSGDTVKVPKGVYKESITIDKSITLRGVSRDDCVIEVNSNKPAVTVDIQGRGKVSIEGLTVKWQLATSDNTETPFAMMIKDSKVEINNCRFVPLGNFKRSPVAVNVMGFSDADIKNCEFEGFEYVICYREGTKGALEDSLIMDCGHQGIIAYSGAKVKIKRNVITGSKFHAVRSTGGQVVVEDNLLINNANRGIYLGNKSGSGSISNNLIIGNATGISGFASSKYVIENNVIADSSYAGISFRNTCSLQIRNNIFKGNQCGWIMHDEGGRNNNGCEMNTFWQNKTDAENFRKTANSIIENPHFKDPRHGDFSLKSGAAKDNEQGLTNTEIFKRLWKVYKDRSFPETYAESAEVKEEVVDSAKSWLKLVDDGNYEMAWEEAAGYFKKAVTKEQLNSSLSGVRKPLGGVISREVLSQTHTNKVPDGPDGEYVVIQFETEFENMESAVETVTPMLDEDGKWRVSGYYIK